jgi:hypothetical protein
MADLVAEEETAMLSAMRMMIAFISLCLFASPAWAWEFTPDPICTLSREAEGSSVVVTYDLRVPEYAISLRRAVPWPSAPTFSIRFDGPRGFTISTARHRLSDGGMALTVTDKGFGNVLDGLRYNETAIAVTGSATLPVPLSGAAPAVEAFRACALAPSV